MIGTVLYCGLCLGTIVGIALGRWSKNYEKKMMTSIDYTQPPPFGMNNLLGLQQNQYYWCRNPSDGTRFICKLENDHWYTVGIIYTINITRDQVICPVKPPEN